jgi:hypothetical protein
MSLVVGREYPIIRVSSTQQDVQIDENDSLCWDKRRFRLKAKAIKASGKGLAPGLTLVDIKSRRGAAPSLK